MNKIRVLLVDDEEELVSTVAERLGMRGFQVQAVTGGERAIELAEQQSFDVAVVDVKMPGVSGITVLRSIRRLRPRLPVLLLTGHGLSEEGEEGMREGAFDYLYKPVDIEDLVHSMMDAIRSVGHE